MNQILKIKNKDPWVMYLIIRDSLNMSIGKTAAQVGHAVGMLYSAHSRLEWHINDCISESFGYTQDLEDLKPDDMLKLIKTTNFDDWKNSAHRKVVLKANDSQWEKLKEKVECYIVIDAGLTELEPGNETVIGLWPCRRSQRPNIIKKLQCCK